MSEDKPNKSLQRLLAERRQLERELKDQHTELVAILFTDIVGSTTYFERRGDIDGMSMVHRHNELLFPIVKQHQGQIVKTIGDAIMAVFREPANAVRAGVAMQRQLATDRKSHPDEEPIHVRIGAHAGRVIVQEATDEAPFDVFGDAVNTSARVESKANGDELLVSAELFSMVPDGEQLEAVPGGALELKGKAEPLPVVAVIWGAEAPRREPESAPAKASPQAPPPEIFVLELGLGPSGLKVAALDGAGDKGTVKTYAELPVSLDGLNAIAKKLDTFLRGGAGSYLDRIQELGRELFDQSLDDRTRRLLGSTTLTHLRLHIDDDLAHVPWELLFDGHQFLGLRFAMGRMVAARAERRTGAYAGNGAGGHALVISNPSGDLSHAAEEGTAVAGLLEDGFGGEVRHIEGPCTKSAFLQAMNGCRLLHFAGHAVSPTREHRGGFQLSDGIATPNEVAQSVGTHAPALVFANTCYASTDRGWTEVARGVTDLASALLLQGVRHYLGPMGDIPDGDALRFALRFYEQVLAGQSFAEGTRSARVALTKKASEPISFARYVLYGDPRTRLAAEETQLSRGKTRSTPSAIPRPPAEIPEEPWDEDSSETRIGAPVTTIREPVIPREEHRPDTSGGGGLGKIIIGVGAAVIVLGGLAFAWRAINGNGDNTAAATGTPAPTQTAVSALPRTGPIRISILPFKNVGGESSLQYLSGGLSETVTTDFGSYPDLQLVERFQLEDKELDRAGLVQLDILGEIEFAQGKYVDQKTAAALGKIKGTEVLLVGSFQQAGNRLRASGRFVDVETGEILYTFKVDKPSNQPFELQDEVAVEARKSVETLRSKLRGG